MILYTYNPKKKIQGYLLVLWRRLSFRPFPKMGHFVSSVRFPHPQKYGIKISPYGNLQKTPGSTTTPLRFGRFWWLFSSPISREIDGPIAPLLPKNSQPRQSNLLYLGNLGACIKIYSLKVSSNVRFGSNPIRSAEPMSCSNHSFFGMMPN